LKSYHGVTVGFTKIPVYFNAIKAAVSKGRQVKVKVVQRNKQ